MVAFRIADARHAIFDGTGAMLHGGRWNSPGKPVIYAAETYAGAMLEILVHGNLPVPPRNQQVVRISIPEDVLVESVLPAQLSGWDGEDVTATRAFGDRWVAERRTAVLCVPSVVTAGREFNVLINPAHTAFGRILAGTPEPIAWDTRLFGKALHPV